MASRPDQMSPEASPDQAGEKIGNRRVNSMPMYIVGTVMTAFLLVMVLVAANRAAKQKQPPKPAAEKVENTSMFAKAVAGDRQSGIVQPKTPQAAASPTAPGGAAMPSSSEPAPGAVTIVRPANPDAPPTPPNSSGVQRSNGPGGGSGGAGGDAADRIRIMKMQQFDEAVKAKTGLSVTPPRSAGSSPAVNGASGGSGSLQQPGDPLEIYKSQLALVQNSGLAGTGGASAQPGQAAPGNGTGVAPFGNSGAGDRWKLESKVQPPRSRYELRAGYVVPATLISGINSELPGQIMAQVSQNVYDTATGRYLLIPQGCRLVGTYASNVAYGQAWLLVAWQRIVFPDGKAMDIGSMPGANSAGYAGFKDRVNNHYFRIFGSALLMSGVIAGVATSQPPQDANSAPTVSSAMSQALGLEFGQVAAQMIAKNLNVAPTLEIRPGYRFNVMVTKDLNFSKPYQPFDY
ncbi:TrbI/VirB10 family protein [Geomonas azotofigens]|uniref:TrbI/VirB10 family protein n=1 Tax=Geomonas azotofigens TaxID=2843196 RepID=UPI002E2D7C54|nr:TrbI/VirB10 family protein [Geomonas azotofigens]